MTQCPSLSQQGVWALYEHFETDYTQCDVFMNITTQASVLDTHYTFWKDLPQQKCISHSYPTIWMIPFLW